MEIRKIMETPLGRFEMQDIQPKEEPVRSNEIGCEITERHRIERYNFSFGDGNAAIEVENPGGWNAETKHALKLDFEYRGKGSNGSPFHATAYVVPMISVAGDSAKPFCDDRSMSFWILDSISEDLYLTYEMAIATLVHKIPTEEEIDFLEEEHFCDVDYAVMVPYIEFNGYAEDSVNRLVEAVEEIYGKGYSWLVWPDDTKGGDKEGLMSVKKTAEALAEKGFSYLRAEDENGNCRHVIIRQSEKFWEPLANT